MWTILFEISHWMKKRVGCFYFRKESTKKLSTSFSGSGILSEFIAIVDLDSTSLISTLENSEFRRDIIT